MNVEENQKKIGFLIDFTLCEKRFEWTNFQVQFQVKGLEIMDIL